MGHIISIAASSEKSGKSTTAVNLAASYAIAEKKTLLIDCDPWHGASFAASILSYPAHSEGFYALMTDQIGIDAAILSSSMEFLKILPAGPDFSRADFLFGDTDGHYFKLSDMIQSIKHHFDYIVIDCPANMPNLLKNIILSTDWIVIPLDSEFRSPTALVRPLAGIKQLLSLVLNLQEQFQVLPKIIGILLNKCEQIENISDKRLSPIMDDLHDFMLSTRIPARNDISEAFSLGKPLAIQNIKADTVPIYMDLADEIGHHIHRTQEK